MCFFTKNKQANNSETTVSPKQLSETECDSLCKETEKAIDEANALLANKNEFVDVSRADLWIDKYSYFFEKTFQKDLRRFRKCSGWKNLRLRNNVLVSIPQTLKSNIIKHNDELAQKLIDEGYRLIGEVEGRKLDKQQMMAIVKPSRNRLIVAGAGTGKTTTIVGKIKYILKKGICKPEEILVLSFTRASAAEMSERIQKETGEPITASTFHKLGLEIIKAAEGNVPKIYANAVSTFVREKIKEMMQNPDSDYKGKLCGYALYYRNSFRTEQDFSDRSEYLEYLAANAPITLNGEAVKSYGELDIANFLYQNQIRYEYEASYKFDTNNEEYGQYHPDFYLPDYDIYIEYFGIDRKGGVADYFSGKGELSASEAYQKGMEWKRNIHSVKNTLMLECYAYEKFENTLLDNLEKKLKEKNVELKPLPTDELWNRISAENNGIIDGVTELFGTVISLIKSNNYSFDKVEKLAKSHRDAISNLYLLSLIKPIYTAYDEMLKDNDEIDFNDMINKAAEYVRTGQYINPYKYVIVDEYQDISKARFNLLYELRKSSFFDLFCVGDDWQSIYRFAGSDINYIVDFEKYWGPTEIGRIETTYRFTDSLIEISSGFIMKNKRQLKKSIKGQSCDNRFSLGVIEGYNDKIAINFMLDKLKDLPQNSEVLFLGRYGFDKDLLSDNTDLSIRYDNSNGETLVKYDKRPDLKMKFMTAHRSKGLQADYVFVINNKNSRMGFPSKIQDASIMDLLLEKTEAFPYAEERRLFYVALTRAKTKVFLITVKNRESVFVLELMDKYHRFMTADKYTCPYCGGKLIKKSGPYGEFFGCSNYGKTGCDYIRKIEKNQEKNSKVM